MCSFFVIKAVNSYDNWRRMIVKDQDPTFVGDFLGIGMDILSRSWHLREALGNSVEQTDAMFSILPKKVKVVRIFLMVFFFFRIYFIIFTLSTYITVV